MRICLTVPSIDHRFGGPVQSAAGLAMGLKANGQEAFVVGCGDDGADLNVPAIGRFHSTPIPRSVRPIVKAVRSADVVHVLGYRDPVGTIAMRTAHKHGIPYVLEPLGMYRPFERSLLLKRIYATFFGNRLVRAAGAIIVTSYLEASHFEGSSVDHLVELRPNGVDPTTLQVDESRSTIRERFGIPPSVPLVLSLGRITQKKRFDHLVRAMEHLDGYWLLIAGPDSNDGGLETIEHALATSKGKDRVVLYTGGIWGADKVRALVAADCFCLPSSWETSSIAILEAAAMGVPVVASDRCGGMEFLGKAGGLVAPFANVDALARLLRTAVEDDAVKIAAKNEAERILQELTWEEVAKKQLSIYESKLVG